jgi:hypothetical protein
MQKTLIVVSSLLYCGAVSAAVIPSVEGITFALTGKYTPKITYSCSKGGSGSKRISKLINLPAEIQFLPNGVFKWSDSGFTVAANSEVSGDWTQKPNGKISLSFDEDNYSAIKILSQVLSNQYVNVSQSGATANAVFSTTKYTFSATVDKKQKLLITETGGFKVKAKGSYGGFSNTCTYKFDLTRTYGGKPK